MLNVSKIKKVYGSGHTELTVLDELDLEYAGRDFLGIYGSSGSGKSTLLHIIGGLDMPSGGKVLVNNRDLYALPETERALYRNKTVGFVFQFYHLLKEFTALENVMIPCLISGMAKRDARKLSKEMLGRVGLVSRSSHRPTELSGGEQQRVAIARSIVMSPELLLADEPTGNLDKKAGSEILELLLTLNREEKMGIIMVTHDSSLVDKMDRVLEISYGKLFEKN